MLLNTVLKKYCHGPLIQQYAEIARIWQQDWISITESTACIEPISGPLNSELKRWLSWVNKNIIIPMANETYTTTGVKVRIATGMLNRIESLTDLEKIQIHCNFTQNIRTELQKLMDDELPF